jgi:hypothetical protein
MNPKDAYTALVGLSLAMLLVPASIVLMVTIEEGGFRWALQVTLAGSFLLAAIGVFGSRHRFFILGAGMLTVLTVVVLAIDGGFGVLALQLVFLSCILGTLLGARTVRTKQYLAPEGDVWPEVDGEMVNGMWRMALDHGLRVGAAFLLALMLIAISLLFSLGSAPLLLVVVLIVIAVISLFVALRALDRSES